MRTALGRRDSTIVKVRLDALRVPRPGVGQRQFGKARGDALAASFDFGKFGYPVVALVDDVHWLIDGQHRVYALRKQASVTGATLIDCEVYEGMSERERADLFLGRNNTKSVSAFDRFCVAVTAGYERERAIMAIVESVKLQIHQDRRPGCIYSVGALQRVYDTEGGDVLARVLRSLRDAYDAAPAAFGRAVIEGLGLLFGRHPKLDDEALVSALGKDRHGVHGLLRRTEDYRERLGRPQPQCLAAAAVDVYNRRQRRKARLPRWWKV